MISCEFSGANALRCLCPLHAPSIFFLLFFGSHFHFERALGLSTAQWMPFFSLLNAQCTFVVYVHRAAIVVSSHACSFPTKFNELAVSDISCVVPHITTTTTTKPFEIRNHRITNRDRCLLGMATQNQLYLRQSKELKMFICLFAGSLVADSSYSFSSLDASATYKIQFYSIFNEKRREKTPFSLLNEKPATRTEKNSGFAL